MSVWLTANIAENNVNIPNNTSDVTVNLYANWNAGTWANDSPAGYIIIDGTRYDFTANFNVSQVYSGSQLIATRMKTVAHNLDGSKTANCSAWFAGNGNYDVTWSGAITLTTIPRAATMSGYANFNIGSNASLSISNPGSLYNTLDFVAGGVTVKSVEGVLSGSISTLITASTLYGLTPNSNTLLVTAQLKTWTNSSKTTQVGDTQIATASAIVTNSNPVFTDFSFADIDTTVITLTDSDQKLVSGYSDVRASVSVANKATAQNSATMDKYRLTIGTQVIEVSYSDSATVILDLANISSGSIKVEAIDSRGNATAVIKAATLLTLTPVFFNSAEILRDNGADSTVKLDLSGKLHLLDFGTVTNSLKSVKYAYKETSQSDDYYSALTSITSSVDGSGNITLSDLAINGNLGSSGFTVEKSYNIKLVLQDELTTATLVIELLSGVYVIHLGRTDDKARVGIGMKNAVGQGLQVKDGHFNGSGGRLIGNMYGVCSTAAATTAKTVAIDGFELVVGQLVTVQFTYAVPASATLNVNGAGAKAIYHGTAAIAADVIPAGSVATFVYDGTYFRLTDVGSPTGIMEIGSNSNGNYVKFFNGLMICWRNGLSVILPVSQSEWSITLPQTFVSPPFVTPQLGWATGTWGVSGFVGCQSTTTYVSFSFLNNASIAQNWVSYGYIAVGRWK
ncbi:MAG: DUF859 family phage minor structural protein [Anaerofustis sp.]